MTLNAEGFITAEASAHEAQISSCKR